MDYRGRVERRRVRWFFAGLLAISAVIDIVGALLVQHQTRAAVLEALLPTAILLGGRTGAVLSGLALFLLASGIARGKRVAFRLTVVVLIATIAFELIKDLDFEAAALFAWILAGLWWFRHHFDADSDPRRIRLGLIVLGLGLLTGVVYAIVGAALLENQLRPEFGVVTTLESLAASLAGSATGYRALTERASWFLSSLPIVTYALIIVALTQLLRPVLAPRPASAERERVHLLLNRRGRNYISHLALQAGTSYHWVESKACVAFTLRRRTALALGDPIGPPDLLDFATRDFIAYCDKQDWIPAFYQVDEPRPYRRLDLTLVSIGAEAILDTAGFSLAGGKRANVRHTVRRCEREGVRFSFTSGPEALAVYGGQLQDVSGHWLRSHHSPELRYSLGTLATLTDPDIVVGMAFRSDGRLEAFVSWLPVPARKAWTLDLMRRRPDSVYGAIDALIAKSVAEADERGVAQLSLGVAPRVIASPGVPPALDRALRAVYWGLDRFQRSSTLREFKEKFGPRWEDRYLVVPGSSTLPEVMVALALAHLPPIPAIATWIRSWLSPERRPGGRRALA